MADQGAGDVVQGREAGVGQWHGAGVGGLGALGCGLGEVDGGEIEYGYGWGHLPR